MNENGAHDIQKLNTLRISRCEYRNARQPLVQTLPELCSKFVVHWGYMHMSFFLATRSCPCQRVAGACEAGRVGCRGEVSIVKKEKRRHLQHFAKYFIIFSQMGNFEHFTPFAAHILCAVPCERASEYIAAALYLIAQKFICSF